MTDTTKFNVASNNAEDFGSAFLDDFEGLITSSEFCIYPGKEKLVDVNGTKEKRKPYYLYVDVEFDVGDEVKHTERYFAGYLNQFVPSKDGQNVAGPDGTTFEDYLSLAEGTGEVDNPEELPMYRGPYAIGPGQLLPKLSWYQLNASIKALDPTFAPGPRADALCGHRLHMNRIMSQEDNKKKAAGEKVYPTLVATAIIEKPQPGSQAAQAQAGTAGKAKGGKKAAPAQDLTGGGATAATSANGDGVDTVVQNAVLDVLARLAGVPNGLPVARQDIAADVLNAVPAEHKGAALQRVTNEAWLGQAERPWTFDNGKISI